MKKLPILLIYIFAINVMVAQVPRKMVVEHFTNTKCSVCASRNPGFETNMGQHPEINYISIHPSSPYATCKLSQDNKAANDARTKYYGVYGGTPRLVVNGKALPQSADYTSSSIFGKADSTSFSLKIYILRAGEDSIKTRIIIKKESASTKTKCLLFAALAEDTVFFNGGNGELKHYNVCRASLYAPAGESIVLPINIADSVVIEKTVLGNTIWDINRMRAVALVQDSSTKTLIQSEVSKSLGKKELVNTGAALVSLDEFLIYPSPADNYINVQGINLVGYLYDVVQLNGVLVKHQSHIQFNRLDVSDVANGTYIFRFYKDNLVHYKKVIIAR
jgi:hypothetical protein